MHTRCLHRKKRSLKVRRSEAKRTARSLRPNGFCSLSQQMRRSTEMIFRQTAKRCSKSSAVIFGLKPKKQGQTWKKKKKMPQKFAFPRAASFVLHRLTDP